MVDTRTYSVSPEKGEQLQHSFAALRWCRYLTARKKRKRLLNEDNIRYSILFYCFGTLRKMLSLRETEPHWVLVRYLFQIPYE